MLTNSPIQATSGLAAGCGAVFIAVGVPVGASETRMPTRHANSFHATSRTQRNPMLPVELSGVFEVRAATR
jgi:hypothetical protein